MRRLLLVSPVLALALAACGGGSPATPTTAPAASAPTTAPAATTAPEAPAATRAPSSSGGAKRSFDNVGEGLDQLDSYRLRFQATITAADGSPAGEMMFVQELIKADNASRFLMTAEGDAFASGQAAGTMQQVEIVQIGDTNYMVSGEGTAAQCASFSGSENAPLDSFNPQDLTGAISDATLVAEGETVNGIRSDHYRFSQTATAANATTTEATGDLWVAQDGGYLVKYSGTAKGAFGATGGTDRTMVWTYDIEDINAIDAIEIPASCANQTGAGDIPLPEGITEQAMFGKTQTFKSTGDVATMIAFFETELPAAGWTAGDKIENGTNAQLAFSKDGRNLTVTIGGDPSGTTVVITEE